eukprot:TRINITY_DN3498_c0_g1_i2.p1 TRINITY_DN3498_c0_g1~~TRINITY_DN3498_c0_g1_i2.p1  ORF type:complete len:392 (+),score=65.29 TRINITY_DN3498_c0_g1_i2:75-1250(+)
MKKRNTESDGEYPETNKKSDDFDNVGSMERKTLEEELGRLDKELLEINSRLQSRGISVEDENKVAKKELKKKRSKRSDSESDSESESRGNIHKKQSRKRKSSGYDSDEKPRKKQKDLKGRAISPDSTGSNSRSSKRVRLNPALEFCQKLLAEIMNHDYGWPFNQPVDPVVLNLPDYFDIIKNPMDLGTIKRRLNRGNYETVSDFGEDVRLVWSNALLYNPKHTDIHYMAKTLSVIFEEQFPKAEELESCPPILKQGRMRESISELKRSIKTVEERLKDLRQKGLDWTKTESFRATHDQRSAKVRPGSSVKVREFTYDEKTRLSYSLHELSSENLKGVIQIIEEQMPQFFVDDAQEYELNLDSLDNITLSRLEDYVNKCSADGKKLTAPENT